MPHNAKPPLRAIWDGMLQRCNNPNAPGYRFYGKRGVKVCARWSQNFEAFVKDVGARPSSEHSLDRYPDTTGDYEPGNVRWATATEQARNRSNTKLTVALAREIRAVATKRTSQGDTYQTIADQFGVSYGLVAKIMANEVWKEEDVPKQKQKKPPVGRPKTLPAELDTRFQIRCAKSDEAAWKKHAKALGYSTSSWIRKHLNAAMAAGE